ncbi:unnamed protein product [Dicrocoelium dendriticum]|nr:unnamed protein product [Dicrocoelium dendriticum]
MRILAWLHFPINLFCLGYYVLRCCAATDPARFVLTYGSIIDLIAIPPTLFAPFMAKRHLDLNFLRATCLFNYVEVLTFLGIIKSNRSIQSARICFALFTMWMVGSGLMHGVELHSAERDYPFVQHRIRFSCTTNTEQVLVPFLTLNEQKVGFEAEMEDLLRFRRRLFRLSENNITVLYILASFHSGGE